MSHTLTEALDLYADGQLAGDEFAAFVEQYRFTPIVDGGGFPQRGTVQEILAFWEAGLIPDEDYERILNAERPPPFDVVPPVGLLGKPDPQVKALRHAVRYNPRARDADSDRRVQEGTPFERPALPLPEAWQNPFEHHGDRPHHSDKRPSLFSGAGRPEDEKKPAPPKRTDKQKRAEADARRTVQFWFADHPGQGLTGYYETNPYGSDTGDAEYDEAFNDAVLEYDREIGRSKPETWGKRNIEDTGMPRNPLAVMSAGSDEPSDPLDIVHDTSGRYPTILVGKPGPEGRLLTDAEVDDVLNRGAAWSDASPSPPLVTVFVPRPEGTSDEDFARSIRQQIARFKRRGAALGYTLATKGTGARGASVHLQVVGKKHG